MDELTAVIMECMVSDLKTSKKYQINKSRLIRLAQNYCTYKMPKMNQIIYDRYKGAYSLRFFNQQNELVKITLDRFWGNRNLQRVEQKAMLIEQITSIRPRQEQRRMKVMDL